ncbi:MAG: universal stress protein [Chromatiales bacterium]|nr:universal stress protein [Chromatiales bacterium]
MSFPTYKTILYATDLGDNMRPVFRHAIGLAKHYDANVIMFHAVEPLSDSGQWVLETYLSSAKEVGTEGSLKKVLEQMRERLEKFYADEMADPKLKVDPKCVSDIVVVSGHPAEAIKKFADEKGVDLIVMGTHTKTGLHHGLLGSTARKLTHIIDRPVLVVPVSVD